MTRRLATAMLGIAVVLAAATAKGRAGRPADRPSTGQATHVCPDKGSPELTAAARHDPVPVKRGVSYVYVTEQGKRYHAKGCRYLKKNSTRMTKKKAKRKGYTPCKVCKPG